MVSSDSCWKNLTPVYIVVIPPSKKSKIRGMDKVASPPFRAHILVETERSRPEPIFVVALTGVDFWLRLAVPPDVLVRSPCQRQREIARIIREHYAVWGKRRGPFGAITGYIFRSLADRATRYNDGN